MRMLRIFALLCFVVLPYHAIAKQDKEEDPGEVEMPSITPTTSVFPSPAPVQPSLAPSESLPTLAPSEAIKLTKVDLPAMDIEFKISGSPEGMDELESTLASFIRDTVWSTAHNLGNMTSVVINVKISAMSARRRLQINMMNASVSGFVYFSGETTASKEKLKRVLESYFANWGENDLEERLTDGNIVVSDVEVLLDGELVESVSSESTPSNNVSQNPEPPDTVSAGLIAGLVVGCVVFVTSLAYVFYQRRQDGKLEAMVTTPMSSPSRSRGGGATPDDLDAEFFPVDAPSLSGLSMEDSILTTSNNSSEESNAKNYDPKRLDRVISSAKNFVERHQHEGYESDEEISKLSRRTPSGECPWENLGESPGENLGESPGENLGECPWENLGECPWENLGESPGENLGESPWENPGESPGENLGESPGEIPNNETPPETESDPPFVFT
jgi:hypothetical protein